jgi:urease accessory protein
MPRVQKVLAKGALKGRDGPPQAASGGVRSDDIADTLLLKFDDRRRQQGFVFGGRGTCIEFDFAEPPDLRTDDILVLDDGRLAEIVADIEPVLELRAGSLVTTDFAAVVRLLLALGERHLPVQILANRIRLQKQPAVEALVAEHGLKAAELTAPFEPNNGKQASAHDHSLGHHHHDHGEGHGHGHHDGHDHDHHGGHGHHHHDG